MAAVHASGTIDWHLRLVFQIINQPLVFDMRFRIFATDASAVDELDDDILFDDRLGSVVQCEGNPKPVSFVYFMSVMGCEANALFRYVVHDNRPGLFGLPFRAVPTIEMDLFPPGFPQFEKDAEYRPARTSHF
jgi:hypothetical protein